MRRTFSFRFASAHRNQVMPNISMPPNFEAQHNFVVRQENIVLTANLVLTDHDTKNKMQTMLSVFPQ